MTLYYKLFTRALLDSNLVDVARVARTAQRATLRKSKWSAL